jgi:hypothetical protein
VGQEHFGMSTDGVKAGRAYVELSTKDKLSAGLKRAKERLAAWAKGLALIGGGITAFSTSILGGLMATVRQFTTIGGELDDMRTATGVSVEMLSALGYAARQSGADLGAVHAALRGLAKFSAQVAAGGKGAIATLEHLGINASAFLAARPDQRLAMLADGLKNVHDPGVRAALAMKVLGKSGEALLPMLVNGAAGLNAFIDRAHELGIVISDEEARKADALGDAWDDLLSVFGAIAFRTGAALADTLQAIIQTVIVGATAVSEFVRNNQILVIAMAAGAVAGVALGGVFLTLAGLCAGLSLIMGGLNAMITFATWAWGALATVKAVVSAVNTWLAATLTAEGLAALWAAIQTSILSAAMTVLTAVTSAAAAVLTFFTTPLGLIVLGIAAVSAALAAGAIWFFGYTQAGQFAVSTLKDLLVGLWQTATQTFAGIFDAILAGRWDLAVNVAMAGMNVAWQKGVYALKSLWAGFKEWLIGLFADMFSTIFQKLAEFQAMLVGGVNAIRGKLGFEAIQGFGGIDKLARTAQRQADNVKRVAAAGKDAELAAARRKVEAAQAELDRATGAAKAARQEQSDKRKAALSGLLDGLSLPTQSVTSPGGTTLGTFSGAIAGLLGRSGPDDAVERTADASEAMEEHLDAIRRKVEEGGLAFE